MKNPKLWQPWVQDIEKAPLEFFYIEFRKEYYIYRLFYCVNIFFITIIIFYVWYIIIIFLLL